MAFKVYFQLRLSFGATIEDEEKELKEKEKELKKYRLNKVKLNNDVNKDELNIKDLRKHFEKLITQKKMSLTHFLFNSNVC